MKVSQLVHALISGAASPHSLTLQRKGKDSVGQARLEKPQAHQAKEEQLGRLQKEIDRLQTLIDDATKVIDGHELRTCITILTSRVEMRESDFQELATRESVLLKARDELAARLIRISDNLKEIDARREELKAFLADLVLERRDLEKELEVRTHKMKRDRRVAQDRLLKLKERQYRVSTPAAPPEAPKADA